MVMKIYQMSAGGVILVLMLTAAAALAGSSEGMNAGYGMPPMMGPGGIASDKQYVYVLAGPKIMQFNLEDLSLLKTVDLPKPTPPKEEAAMSCPLPPPGGGPHGLCAGDGVLYVLVGPMIYRFRTPDLALETSAQLPKPEMPKTGN